jgi:hypothetical protein
VAVKKTALGIQVMKDRSVSLTPQQRSALILVDGKRNAVEVVRMTAAVGVSLKDIESLMGLGLIASDEVLPAPELSQASLASATVQEVAKNALAESNDAGIDFKTALNAAITLCSEIGFKGFSLNMALTGVDSIEKLQKLAPEIRKAAGDKKYAMLHAYIFGKSF